MLRPVELDAAGDPRSRQADERGLDHGVAVEEVDAGDQVARRRGAGRPARAARPAAASRSRGGWHASCAGSALSAIWWWNGQRVDPPGRALVDTPVEVGRVLLRLERLVGGQRERLFPDGSVPVAQLSWTRGQRESLDGEHTVTLGATGSVRECRDRRHRLDDSMMDLSVRAPGACLASGCADPRGLPRAAAACAAAGRGADGLGDRTDPAAAGHRCGLLPPRLAPRSHQAERRLGNDRHRGLLRPRSVPHRARPSARWVRHRPS